MQQILHVRLGAPLDRRGDFPTVDQDSHDDVVQCVAVVVATRPGERLAIMDFGVDDPTFAGVDAGQLTDVVEGWEPRVSVDATIDAVGQVGRETTRLEVGR
jgi:phage baseplate assembly protein W